MRRRGLRAAPGLAALKKSAKECRCFIRDANDLVGCLPVEFEIELRLGATIVPVAETLELVAPEAPRRECAACNGDTHARRLSGEPALLWDRFGRGDNAACEETRPAFVLTCEQEDRIALGNVFASKIGRASCRESVM